MRSKPRPDRILSILGGIQSDMQGGLSVGQACRKAGIGLTTYYRWKALQEEPVSNEHLKI
jgi:hypothetical protein